MSYSQEIYDAVRSKISGGDISEAVSEIARNAFDISHHADMVRDEFLAAAHEMQRPSVLYRPTISQDGNAWLAILGDLPTGVVGVGATPAEAMLDFDRVWYEPRKVVEYRPPCNTGNILLGLIGDIRHD